MFRRISVIGLGYIGLPTAAIFAEAGVEVLGVDVSQTAVDSVNSGEPHIVEPNLGALLRRVVFDGKLRASMEPEPADAFLIAVPTPFKNENGGKTPDLSYIRAAAESIAPVLKTGDLVVLESTVPPGATEQLADWLADLRPDLVFPPLTNAPADVQIAHCPERVLPGRILEEVVHNDRVIGGMTTRCAQRALTLYKTVVKGDCYVTTARTAELAKLTENAYRDVNIAFANELSLICDKLDVNVWELIRMANLHPRVNILQPGPGVGGHCIAVDPWFIVDAAPKETRLIRLSREINDAKPEWVINKIIEEARPLNGGAVIGCLGLSYKADVDDLRESPAMEIVKGLAQRQAGRIIAVEPNIAKAPDSLTELGVEFADLNQVVEQADVLALLVDHESFKGGLRRQIRNKIVVDTRGAW